MKTTPGKSLLLSFIQFPVSCILFSIFFLFTAQPSYAQWAATYGVGDLAEAHSIQQTRDGGYVVACGADSFGDGAGDFFWVLKLNADGTIDWQKRYGAAEGRASSIQQTSDGGYIAGGTTSFGAGAWDFWVLKLNSDGSVVWQKTYGGTGFDRAFSIQQTRDGGYIVAGGTTSFGAGAWDFWVLKLNSDGSVVWQKTYGGVGSDIATSIQQTRDGGYIVAGETHGLLWVLNLNSNGTVAWQKTYKGRQWVTGNFIQQTRDGGYIVAGTVGTSLWGFLVLKLNADGTVAWRNTYRGEGLTMAKSIKQTADGGYVVAGKTGFITGGYESDIWILKLNEDGSVAWQKTYGGDSIEEARSIQQTSDGGYIVAGAARSFGDDIDCWILKLRPDGTIDPACDFIQDTDVVGVASDATIQDTDVSGIDTQIIPEDTSVEPLDTEAIANFLCKAEDCSNEVDDDADGLVDCEDLDCGWYEACFCNDGMDNDLDGRVDCDDPDCCAKSACPRCSYLSETLLSQETTLSSVEVSGDLTGTLNFTSLELVGITTGPFSGKGFSKGEWETTLEGADYRGSWYGSIFLKPSERRIYLKGMADGDISATVEGFLTESIQESGIYDQYQATWQICSMKGTTTTAIISLSGKVSYQGSSEFPGTELYFLQVNQQAGVSGGYDVSSLNTTLTHLRVSSDGNPYQGEGFSFLSYNSETGSGQGWMYNKLTGKDFSELKGLMSSPYSGVGKGTLASKTLNLTIQRVDEGIPPMADLEVKVWGPQRVSPGQTVDYIVEYRNDGPKSAEDVVVVCELPSLAQYISSSFGGIYRWQTHELFWKLGTVYPGQRGDLTAKVYFPWGLAQGIQQSTLAVYGTTGLEKDYYLNPDREPLVDAQYYLNYQPVTITAKLTTEEFSSELDADEKLNDLHQYAEELGYSDVFAIKGILDDGSNFTSGVMSKDSEVLFLIKAHDKIFLAQYTKTGVSIFDKEGGMSRDIFGDDSIDFWGSWLSAEQRTEAQVEQQQCSFKRCRENCMWAEFWKDYKINALQSSLESILDCLTTEPGGTCLPSLLSGQIGAVIEAVLPANINENRGYCETVCSMNPCAYDCKPFRRCGGFPIWDPVTQTERWEDGVFLYKCNYDTGLYEKPVLETVCGQAVGECFIGPDIECREPPWGVQETKCVRIGELCNPKGSHSMCNYGASITCTAHDPNIKYGPQGAVEPGKKLDYKVEYENEGEGIAFGVYFTDTLDEDLDDSTLVIGKVYDVDTDEEIGPVGTYDPITRTITWLVGNGGEVGPGKGGYADFSINVRGDAPRGTEIINYATVYFPSVPEETRTNAIVSIIPFEICDNGEDDDGDGFADCDDPECFGPACPEVCGDGLDNDGDSWVDCTDLDCPPCPEVCDNAEDDDKDGLTDCEDPDCCGQHSCPACFESTDYTKGLSRIKFTYLKNPNKDSATLRMCVDQDFCDALYDALDKTPEEIVLILMLDEDDDEFDCSQISIPRSKLKYNGRKNQFTARSSKGVKPSYFLHVDCKRGWLKINLSKVNLKDCVSNPVKTCMSIPDGPCYCAEEAFVEKRYKRGKLKDKLISLSLKVKESCPSP